jgi:hypothetical protein
MSCGTRAQDPARAILTVPGSSVLPSEITHLPTGTAYCTAACGSAALRQPAPSPVLRLPWPRAPLADFPVRAPAAGAITAVLLTHFAAARQFISARPYYLSALREKLYPCDHPMSTPATTDFSAFEAEIIRSESRGGLLPREDPALPPRGIRPAGRPVPAASAGPAVPPAAATRRRPGHRRQGRIRLRARPRATMPVRACHTSSMQTSETYMIGRHARLHQQRDLACQSHS